MINDLMNYNLKIYQDKDFFKYSIDSVLLAEFVNINYRTENIMDLCTGNAPIPLILSLKTNKNIYGIELQKKIYELGIKSVKLNNIKNINLINADIRDINKYFDKKFDIITCNPPYFKYNEKSIINMNTEKAIARHEIKIDLKNIIKIASDNIKHSGSLYLVHRCDRLVELMNYLKEFNFGLRRLQFVYDNYESMCCFILVEAKYKCKDDLKVLKPLYINKYLEDL